MKALIYARISTAGQNEGASLDSQVSECRAFAHQNGYQVAKEVKEIFSGAYLFDRPLLNECREEIRAGAYDALIVYDVDRLSRNVPHLGILLDECYRYNTKLVFVKNDFENSPEGMLLFSIRGYLAEAERLKIIERTTRGRRAKAKQGTLSFKRKLFGYYLDEKGKRQIYEPEAEAVRLMFELYLNGESLRSITRILNEKGMKTPTGSYWWAFSLRDVLTNPAYMGRTVIFRQRKETKYIKGERHLTTIRTAENTVELPEGTTPAIITEEVFLRVQELLKKNKHEKRAKPKREFLLRGFIWCATCGRRMSPQVSNKYKYRSYVCNSKQNPALNCKTKMCKAGEAERLVWDEVIKALKKPKTIEKKIKKAHARHLKNPQKEMGSNLKEIQKLEKEIKLLVTRAESVSDEVWRVMQKRIELKEAELSNLRAKQSVLKEQAEDYLNYQTQVRDFTLLAKKILPRQHELSFEDKTDVLAALETEILWDGELLTVNIGDEQYYGKSNPNGYFNNTVNLPKIKVF